jgi:predicted  nucleic acid-binding Zn-ribbon protein
MQTQPAKRITAKISRKDRDLEIELVRLAEGQKSQLALMQQGFAMADKRFEDMNKRFDDVNKRFDDVNKRFEDMNKRFDDVNKKFVMLMWFIGILQAVSTGTIITFLKLFPLK